MKVNMNLFEGLTHKDVRKERAVLVEKWTQTGLLKGLEGGNRENMAQLLENQASQVLRESNALSTGGGSMASSGQVQGFSAMTFPMVRRVFGGLVANELVSVQPMGLPSGLIFYLDFTYGSNVGGDAGLSLSNSATTNTYKRGQSLYSNPSGKGVQSGSLAAGGQYDLVGGGYSRLHKASTTLTMTGTLVGAFTGASEAWTAGGTVTTVAAMTGTNARLVGFDSKVESDVEAGTLDYCFALVPVSALTSGITGADAVSADQLALFGFGAATAGDTVAWGEQYQAGTGVLNLRKHNKRGDWASNVFTPNALNGSHILTVVRLTNGGTVPISLNSSTVVTASVAVTDALTVDSTSGATMVIPSFESDFGNAPSPAIAEIDIKIESIAITTEVRKLRARWSPELAQDLNAYQSLDAEVELTQILSEQIAVEIDREILLDLLAGASAANYYWSRAVGKFVKKDSGVTVNLASSLSVGPSFRGNTQEWYQVLVETIVDVANQVHKKTLRGAANFLVCGPDVATILEMTSPYRAKLSIDGAGQVAAPMVMGCEAVGTLSNRFTVYKDPYFPSSKVLVGYKGSQALETGYVYAPYIPIISTQTLYAPDDFTPRRGVMTRYGKKMIRSDYFGTVTCMDMNII